jgi:hypothetical protein
LDVLRTRVQLYPEEMINKGLFKTLINILKIEGTKSLFTGCKARTTASIIIVPSVLNSYEMIHYIFS